VLDRLKMEASQLTDRTVDCDWENLAERRTIARLWALFKAYCGEGVWKAIGARLRGGGCLSGVGHVHLEKGKQNVTLR
jgi:hypothetical protein